MTGTGAIALGVAAAVPGTVVAEAMPGGCAPTVRLGHPAGVLRVGAQARQAGGGAWVVSQVSMSRSARRLMAGQVFVPAG